MTNTIVSENPFVLHEQTNGRILTPSFPRGTTTIRLSEEAKTGLKMLATQYCDGKISTLLEAIGLLQLKLIHRPTEKDVESETTTDECREAGYQDAITNWNPKFLAIYGKAQDTFQESYLRGYFEGYHIKLGDVERQSKNRIKE